MPLGTPVVVDWPEYVTVFLTQTLSGAMSIVTSTYTFPPFTIDNVPV